MPPIAGISVVLAVSGALAATAGTTVSAARVQLLRTAPLTVLGTGFHPREHVRLSVWTGASTTRAPTRTARVTASAAGRFRTTFQRLTAGRCDLIRVIAVGTLGSHAVLKHLPLPACIAEGVP